MRILSQASILEPDCTSPSKAASKIDHRRVGKGRYPAIDFDTNLGEGQDDAPWRKAKGLPKLLSHFMTPGPLSMIDFWRVSWGRNGGFDSGSVNCAHAFCKSKGDARVNSESLFLSDLPRVALQQAAQSFFELSYRKSTFDRQLELGPRSSRRKSIFDRGTQSFLGHRVEDRFSTGCSIVFWRRQSTPVFDDAFWVSCVWLSKIGLRFLAQEILNGKKN